jgi:uncharacterized protein
MKTIHNLVIPFTEIPFEGLQVESSEPFTTFSDPHMVAEELRRLQENFKDPIQVSAVLTPVAQKVDVRGDMRTLISEICDRCTETFKQPASASISTFLMPAQQFSAHDKPGGKVIHGPTRGGKKSRHHSKSKAPVLSDAPGEHEDVSFGSYDGHTVDLRPLVREQLILTIPMRAVCDPGCEGLCLRCGENIQRKECRCKEGPQRVEAEEARSLGNSLADQLQKAVSKPAF